MLAFTIFFYAVDLHDVAQALDAAEHRDRRRRRRLPADDRLGGGDRLAVARADLLFLIIFFWTPPHFWALALYKTEDYARAGIPMLPVVAGARRTRLQILIYSLVAGAGSASRRGCSAYAGCVLRRHGRCWLAPIMLVLALAGVCANAARPSAAARHLFAFSILYLFVLFAVLLVDRGWGGLLGRIAA